MARVPLTDEEILAQIPAARVRGRIAGITEPRAEEAFYDSATGRIAVELKNGCAFGFPPALVEELEHATPTQLAAVEVDPGGEGLHWEELDVDISLPGLIAELLNVGPLAAKYLGQRTSRAKARAARINGQKGGRPRSEGKKVGAREPAPEEYGGAVRPSRKATT